jgi:hypothetical protein
LAAYHQLSGLLETFADVERSCLQSLTLGEDTLLHSASWCDGATVSCLLELGVPIRPNKDKWHPIEAAVQKRADNNYRALIETIDDVDAPTGPSGITMLHMAARWGNCTVIRDLLARRANPRKQDDEGRTALSWAAVTGETAAFKILLPVSDIAAPGTDFWKYNALSCAARNGHAEIIRAALNSGDVEEEALETALRHRDGNEQTPLMLATVFKRPEALRELLAVCDPRDPGHQRSDGSTLFHLAVSRIDESRIYDDEKVRARRTVELILRDGRLSPMTRNKREQTAFDVAGSYDDARRVLRRHMPLSYAEMTESMRRADLEARNPSDVLRLIRMAPQALTDTHQGRTGIKILLEQNKVKVLAVTLHEGLIDNDLLRTELRAIAGVAARKEAGELRAALVRRLEPLAGCGVVLPQLLNGALREREDEVIARLIGLGATTAKGGGKQQTSVFHDLAVVGDLVGFEMLARKHRLVLPLDEWGRRPSSIAAEVNTSVFKELEDRLFDPAPALASMGVRRRTKSQRTRKRAR